MHIDTDDLVVLLKVQQADLELARMKKKLEELPQREVILQTRSKKKAVEQKSEQLEALRLKADGRLTRISDEDAVLKEKQRRIQEEIDELRGDYRSVEARTKELDGCAKRRRALEADLASVGDELAKIEGMQVQVAAMLADLDKKETDATQSFVQEGGALKDGIARCEAERATLTSKLPGEVLDCYEKTAVRSGGVALGRLQGGNCGVCRVAIESGRLIDMKSQGNVGVCPQCKRLLILE